MTAYAGFIANKNALTHLENSQTTIIGINARMNIASMCSDIKEVLVPYLLSSLELHLLIEWLGLVHT
jgi:hypothetical protein